MSGCNGGHLDTVIEELVKEDSNAEGSRKKETQRE